MIAVWKVHCAELLSDSRYNDFMWMSRTHKDISLRYIINNNTAFLNFCQVGLLKYFSE